MDKLAAWVAGIALVGLGVLGVISVNHLEQIENLQVDRDSLEQEVEDLRGELEDQGLIVDELQGRPEVNVQNLARLIGQFRTDSNNTLGRVTDLEDDLSTVRFRLDDVEFQISRPPGCFGGDVVYWASGFNNGLTC